jgi:glycosyltransferase involved in cell wall biosynthesis
MSKSTFGVSVVMPVYNSEKYLSCALKSVLNQSFDDFEFIIIDDCSTDHSSKIISLYNDPRIRYFKNEKNQGISYSLNRGIDISRGRYIIRMDSDDICVPERFSKQISFMENHPKVGVCGSWVKTIGQSEGLWKPSTKPEFVHCATLFSAVLCHPSTILRRELLERYTLRYCLEVSGFEDWDMWRRGACHFSITNIPQVLLHYRTTNWITNQSNLTDEDLKAPSFRLFHELDRRNLTALGLEATNEEKLIHRRLGSLAFKNDKAFIMAANQWLEKLYLANNKAGIYPHLPLQQTLADRWLKVCKFASETPAQARKLFWNSPWFDLNRSSLIVKAKFFSKLLI